MIKCIIFDLGGVVIDFTNDKHYYPYLSKVSGISIRKIKRLIEGKMWAELDKDILPQKEFDRKVAKKLGILIKDVKWYELYKKEARIEKGTIELVRKLRRKYKIAYLSNVDRSRYTETTMELLKPYLKLFDYRFASCEIRLRKPTRRVFRYVLKHMKLKSSEAVFIDNTLENVKGARKAGIKGILFKNAKELEKQLKRSGINL
jgi:epoxide hydrolase-like predicted phosphatase